MLAVEASSFRSNYGYVLEANSEEDSHEVDGDVGKMSPKS